MSERANWIKVSDGLPKLGRRVFVSVDGEGFKTRTIGIWTGQAWRLASLEKLPTEQAWPIEGIVTHWQTLPNAPTPISASAQLQQDTRDLISGKKHIVVKHPGRF